MRKPEPKLLILAGIFFAGILLLTCLVRVPLEILRDGNNAGAYFNMGDLGVYLAAAFLGGPWGALCAGLASLIADLIVGSTIYALPSLVIKAAMAFVVAGFIKKDGSWLGMVRTVSYAGTVMVAGYFIFDLLIMGDYDVAALSLPINVLQLIANGAVAVPVLKLIPKKTYEQPFEFSSARVK